MEQLTKIKTRHCEIWLDQEGFIIVSMKDHTEMDLEEVQACFEAYAKLGFGNGNKTVQLMTGGESSTMPHDARQYVSEHGKHFFFASAIVGHSLAVRLVVNFYNTFYKHEVPFKMFENEDKARQWLQTFRP